MSHRSTPSFAKGGVSWLDHKGEPSDAAITPPEGGWRCFHCDEFLTNYRAAKRHFGPPGSKAQPSCLTDEESARLGEWTGGVNVAPAP